MLRSLWGLLIPPELNQFHAYSLLMSVKRQINSYFLRMSEERQTKTRFEKKKRLVKRRGRLEQDTTPRSENQCSLQKAQTK